MSIQRNAKTPTAPRPDDLLAATAMVPAARSTVDLLHEAQRLHIAGDVPGAEAIYRQVLDRAPENPDALHGLGTILLRRGQPRAAVPLLERSLSGGRVPAQFFVNLAVALEDIGHVRKSLQVLRRGLSQSPKDAFLHQSLAVFLHNRGRIKEALRNLEKAAKINPELPRIHLMLGDLLLKMGSHEKALAHYRKHLETHPDDHAVISRSAYLLGKLDRHEELLEILMPLYEAGTDDPDVYNNIGSALVQMGRLSEAEKFIVRAFELDPARWEFNTNIAGLHMAYERVDAAIEVFKKMKEQNPDSPEPGTDLACAYMRQGREEDALKEIESVLDAHPDHDRAWVALGLMHTAQLNYLGAVEAYRRAIDINPTNFHANSNMALALKAVRNYDDAAFYARKAIHLPDYVPMQFANAFQVFHCVCDHDSIRELGDIRAIVNEVPSGILPSCIFDLMVHADDAESSRWLVGVNRRWGESIEESAGRSALPPLPEGRRHKKVRVGFLSSDLRDHSVGKHIMPLMEHYDRDRIEVYGYSAWKVGHDPIHRKMSELMNGELRTVANLPGREIARIIREDEIDILFELNGHTLGSRFDAIPYRAAPVQVEWLGFPFSVGLKDLDYFLLDEKVAPTDRSLMIEKPLMMPESWTTFDGYPDIPITGTLPLEVNGFVTFGTLNSPYKLTPGSIAAWSRVLKEVPDSHFLVVRGECESRILCSNIAAEFQRNGISTERIGFFDNRKHNVNHLDCYNMIDITLDTFPVTGGTTTCDAMWMGAPVITLVGPSYHQRISYALLSHIGLDELCTYNIDEFVQRAVELAADPESLLFLRQTLRKVLKDSYLCDGPRFAKNFCDVMVNVAREHELID
jgi:protein O-GlcNAc transferase